MEEAKYVESSIALSRNYQERVDCLQGVTGYGKFASLIGANMDYLDSFSEYVALCISNNKNNNIYEEQYGKGIYGVFKRNVLVDPETIDCNERRRRNVTFISSLLTEAALKYGIRELKVFADNKEKQKYFEMVYYILKSYLEESDEFVDYENANKELKKILKNFPINSKQKQKLWVSESLDDYEKISDFAGKFDSNAKYSLSYFLYAIHAQKYGKNFDNTNILGKYYSLLGYQDDIINEIIIENREAYSNIAFEQKRYLSLARGMVKQFNTCAPYLDMNRLTQRAVEMSKFDPYYSEDINLHGHNTYQPQKTISDIFYDSPETVINACKTAISQLTLNDSLKENLEIMMKSWKIDINTVMSILNQADKYQADIKNR